MEGGVACRGTLWSGGIWNREKGLSTRIEENYEDSTEVLQHHFTIYRGGKARCGASRWARLPEDHNDFYSALTEREGDCQD